MNLTPEEYKQLRAIKIIYPWSKWVTRDKNVGIFICEIRPKHGIHNGEWDILDANILPSLIWESEPLNIDEALKNHTRVKKDIELTKDKRVGVWLVVNEGKDYLCSECGVSALYNYFESKEKSKYCPNCGAKMKGSNTE